MLSVNIKTSRKKDQGSVFGNTDKPVVFANLSDFVIVEAGLESGNTAVAWQFDLKDGRKLIVETSGEIFGNMAKSFDRSEKMFKKEDPKYRMTDIGIITKDELQEAWDSLEHSDKKKSELKFEKLIRRLGL